MLEFHTGMKSKLSIFSYFLEYLGSKNLKQSNDPILWYTHILKVENFVTSMSFRAQKGQNKVKRIFWICQWNSQHCKRLYFLSQNWMASIYLYRKKMKRKEKILSYIAYYQWIVKTLPKKMRNKCYIDISQRQ